MSLWEARAQVCQLFEQWQNQLDAGDKAMSMRDFARASIHFAESVKLAERSFSGRYLALSLERLAKSLLLPVGSDGARQNLPTALSAYARACLLYETSSGPLSPDLARCLTGRAKALAGTDMAAAIKLAMHSISIYRQLGHFPTIEPVALVCALMGLSGRIRERQEMLQQFVSEVESDPNFEPAVLGRALYLIAEQAEDMTMLERAQSLASPADVALQVDIAVPLSKLYLREDYYVEAEKLLTQCIELGRCHPDVNATALISALCLLSRIKEFVHQDSFAARRLIEEAGELAASEGPGANLIFKLEGNYFDSAQDFATRISAARASLDSAREKLADVAFGESVDMACFNLGLLLQQSGNFEESIQIWDDGLRDADSRGNQSGYHALRIAVALAHALCNEGRVAEARALGDRVMELASPFILASLVPDLIELEGRLFRTVHVSTLLEVFEQWLDKYSHDEFYFDEVQGNLISLALAYSRLGRATEAGAALTRALTRMRATSLVDAWMCSKLATEFEQVGAIDLASKLRATSRAIRERYE